ncbi:MAG: DNA-directed RNA polymerase subunit omega [Candidatus Xiphinematobacter sp.]|nr:MAG: DNA-directed RNA polymerase subunit omega [Candidatus Xiphinematobacter sp.]
MNSHILEEASKQVGSVPVLINMVSRRVRQLSAGSRPMVVVCPGMGLSDIALSEVAAGKLGLAQGPVNPAVRS